MALHLANIPSKLGIKPGKLLSAVRRPVTGLLARGGASDPAAEQNTDTTGNLPVALPAPDAAGSVAGRAPIALEGPPQHILDSIATIPSIDDAAPAATGIGGADDGIPDAHVIDADAILLPDRPVTGPGALAVADSPAQITDYNRDEEILTIEYTPVFGGDGEEIEPVISLEIADNGADTRILLNGVARATVQGVTGLTEDDVVLMAAG